MLAPLLPRELDGSSCAFDRAVLNYVAKMPPAQFFSHQTAARLWGMPLPPEHPLPLQVSVMSPLPRPRAAGVTGHELDPRVTVVLTHDNLRLSDPASTWCQLSSQIPLADVIAAGDYLVTEVEGRQALVTSDELLAAAEARRGHRAAGIMRDAATRLRPGPRRRLDSLVRLMLCDAGLPEPSLNHRLCDGEFETEFALGYPDYRVVVDVVEEAGRPFRRRSDELERERRVAAMGWFIVIVSDADVHAHGTNTARSAAARVHSALRVGGFRG